MLCKRLGIRDVDEMVHAFKNHLDQKSPRTYLSRPDFHHLTSHFIEFFCDHDVIPPLIFRMIIYRCPDLTRKFLAFGADPNSVSRYFIYPVIASSSTIDGCRTLLEAGADVLLNGLRGKYACLRHKVELVVYWRSNTVEYTFLISVMIEVGLG